MNSLRLEHLTGYAQHPITHAWREGSIPNHNAYSVAADLQWFLRRRMNAAHSFSCQIPFQSLINT